MNKNIPSRPLPPADGLLEPFKSAYLEFSRQTQELMLNPRQLYAMHLRKRFKLMEQQRFPERMATSQDSSKKKDKTKSRSIFASNRPRDSKGRFYSKDSQDLSESLNVKKETISDEITRVASPKIEEDEVQNWGMNPMEEEEIPPPSLFRWDSSQYPQAASTYLNEDYLYD